MRAFFDRGWPVEVFAALLDGSYWAAAGCGLTRPMDDASLLSNAAASVSGTIEEVHEIEWPVSAVHGSDPMNRDLHGLYPVEFIDGVEWWWCTRAGHAVAPVGQLTAKIAKTL
jgi:hypothetical protein